MPNLEPERWSQRWIAAQERIAERHWVRIVGAVLLPGIVSFFSIEAAFVVAVPCAYVAWKELKAIWPFL